MDSRVSIHTFNFNRSDDSCSVVLGESAAADSDAVDLFNSLRRKKRLPLLILHLHEDPSPFSDKSVGFLLNESEFLWSGNSRDLDVAGVGEGSEGPGEGWESRGKAVEESGEEMLRGVVGHLRCRQATKRGQST